MSLRRQAAAPRPARRCGRCARLQREGRLLERLSHPHLVRGYETLREPLPAVVMETLRGETVAHLVARRARRLSAVELGHLGVHLCSAISYMHGQGVLHLDLKPSNVIAEAGRAKIIDLSLARAPGSMRAGIGTWCYMAPEQARGGEVGTAADVWGIAGVLYEAATGFAPFGCPVIATCSTSQTPTRRCSRRAGSSACSAPEIRWQRPP